MAARLMPSRPDLPEHWHLILAERKLGDWAAGVEVAAGRWVQRARDVAFQRDALCVGCRIAGQRRGKKRFRIRVSRVAEELVGRCSLYDLPEIHDGNAVAEE